MNVRELLEAYGAFYGEHRFAIVFTETNRADRPGKDPKRVTTPGWQHTRPLDGPHKGVALLTSRGQHLNPAINLRTSGLVGVESDGPDDLARLEALGLPETLTERSSRPTRLHLYFRPPPELETITKVSFRFEGGALKAATNNYYVCAPARHPSGATYSHLPGPGPSDVAIATMPAGIYTALVRAAVKDETDHRERLAVDPTAKVTEGRRRESIFRFACMLRRWETDADAITAECWRWNLAHCDPPVARVLVARQVDGAMRQAGGQELRRYGQ